MWTTIQLYGGALVAVALVAPLLGVVLGFVFIPLAQLNEAAAPYVLALAGLMTVGGAMTLYMWWGHNLAAQPVFGPFLIAFILMLRNDVSRVLRVPKVGQSQALEVGSLVGNTLGLWLAFLIGWALPF